VYFQHLFRNPPFSANRCSPSPVSRITHVWIDIPAKIFPADYYESSVVS